MNKEIETMVLDLPVDNQAKSEILHAIIRSGVRAAEATAAVREMVKMFDAHHDVAIALEKLTPHVDFDEVLIKQKHSMSSRKGKNRNQHWLPNNGGRN